MADQGRRLLCQRGSLSGGDYLLYPAIEDLRELSDRAVHTLFLETVNKYVNIISARHDSQWTAEVLKEALSRAEALGDRAYQALFNMHLAVSMWQRSPIRLSQKYFDHALAMARDIDDPKFLKSITTSRAFYLTWQGRFRETIEIYETSVQDVEQFPKGSFPLFASIAIAYSYAVIGQVNHALGMLTPSGPMPRKSSDTTLSGMRSCTSVTSCSISAGLTMWSNSFRP